MANSTTNVRNIQHGPEAPENKYSKRQQNEKTQ